jgi:hypothetical protein
MKLKEAELSQAIHTNQDLLSDAKAAQAQIDNLAAQVQAKDEFISELQADAEDTKQQHDSQVCVCVYELRLLLLSNLL